MDDLQLDSLSSNFSRELFAQLLLELPEHRNRMLQAHAAGNYDSLRDCVHQVLGAAVYCESDELETSLRELRLALKMEDPDTIDACVRQAMQTIDSTLQACGRR